LKNGLLNVGDVLMLLFSVWRKLRTFFVIAPKVSDVVQDTKVLLQQSKERLVITYVKTFILVLKELLLRKISETYKLSAAAWPMICRRTIRPSTVFPLLAPRVSISGSLSP
jgi:hypothetical protein